MTNHLFSLVRDGVPDLAKTVIETPEGRRYSYADLIARSGAYAASLRAAGVQPGDRVAVQVEKSPEVIFLYLGAVRAGAVFLPLNTAYTPAEIGYFLGDAEPSVFVCDPGKRDALAEAAAKVRQIWTLDAAGGGSAAEAADRQDDAFDDVPRGPEDLAAILYTSGTTGRSKGAMLTHDNLASNARTLVEFWRFTADDVLVHALPVFHTHGLFVATNTVLASGGSMLFLPRLDPKLILSLMPRASVLMGVPTFYTRLLKEPGLTPEAARGMRLFVSGSAPLLAETHREWQARTGHAILERYGMTETNMSTSNPYDGDRVAGTVGFPLPGVSLRVVDPEGGRVLGPDSVGMIEVKGPNVFQGYWRMPEKTAAEFRADGFFITGDLGKVDTRGYVHIVGRGKDLIISGGFNVYPKEVETEIDALPGVVESAVIGLAHPDFGEAVTAVVVGGAGCPDEAGVQAALEGRLARFKCPKRVLFVDELPRNTMGKVQKNLLREAHAGLYRD
ncbi:Long-chain-fatty-acid--CoA ligase [Methylobacterium tardum]|uniref:Malonyl-CoA synthase n=1 Tax=Methylobacterium tardum TaxID=374432 RepID=A0AA37TE45_9HYPH|nr:malonyl-CoA synthase [Methylobacterium tardum]URD38380.1 malonyl-CoA synthase [Methylobacterium tardum]GJE50000.1 Long-chain-fatty-acid--CoA ligase [Methylobacterium tardum]GLS70207.1 malonyl-CoA synthase [Methylobacterium tardum]